MPTPGIKRWQEEEKDKYRNLMWWLRQGEARNGDQGGRGGLAAV
jgi:hypothetical protein